MMFKDLTDVLKQNGLLQALCLAGTGLWLIQKISRSSAKLGKSNPSLLIKETNKKTNKNKTKQMYSHREGEVSVRFLFSFWGKKEGGEGTTVYSC